MDMDLVPIHLYQGDPTTSEAALYTVPDNWGKVVDVDSILVCNTSGSAATVTLELVRKGGSAGTGNIFLDATSEATLTTAQLLPAGTHIALNPGDAIYSAEGTSNAINVEIDGKTPVTGG
jgi:hypothetical protein